MLKKIFKKKETYPAVERRKGERRKPGDQRFSRRLVGVRSGVQRGPDRRKRERRKKA